MNRPTEKPPSGRPPRPNRRQRNYWPFLLSIASLGLLSEGVGAALTSPRFQVREVVVRGNRDLPAEVILRAANTPVGSNLFLLRARKCADRVALLPRVKRADLHRRLPNRVIIRVEERNPVAIFANGENYYLVDETGVPFALLDRGGRKLPVFRLEAPVPVHLGQPQKDPGFLVGMRSLPLVNGLLPGGEALWIDPRLNLCLNRDDFSVRLGQPEDLEQKVKLFKGLLAADPHLIEKAQYVDLSAPDAPALMPREPVIASAVPAGSG